MRKYIDGYDGCYSVTESGEVYSEERIVYRKHTKILKIPSRKLKPAICKNGYLSVSLWKENKGKTHFIHKLVANAFLPKLEGKNCINHIDGNKTNNCLSNLEWCDHTDNIIHAYKNGLRMSGCNHYLSRISQEQLNNIRMLLGEGKRQCEICRIMNVKKHIVQGIKSGKSYKEKAIQQQ